MLGRYNSAILFLLRHNNKLLILSRLGDFVTFSACFIIQSEGIHARKV